MTYERLITAADEVAPRLSDIAYKLLWRLIAIAIKRGTPEVEASLRWLATGLELSKEGVARATRELAQYIRVTPRDGRDTIYSLPAEWFPPQRTLFADDRLGGNLDGCPGSQDTSVLFPRTPVSHLPGHQCPISQDTCPISQDTSVPFPRTPVPFARTLRPICQDTPDERNLLNARARFESNRIEVCGSSEVLARIEEHFHTVEIRPDQRQDAQILADQLVAYKRSCSTHSQPIPDPDPTVLARLLSIAPIEQLCELINELRAYEVPCGKEYMWFFTVFLHRIHAIPKESVRTYLKAEKSKARPNELTPSLFGDDLVKATAAVMRKLG